MLRGRLIAWVNRFARAIARLKGKGLVNAFKPCLLFPLQRVNAKRGLSNRYTFTKTNVPVSRKIIIKTKEVFSDLFYPLRVNRFKVKFCLVAEKIPSMEHPFYGYPFYRESFINFEQEIPFLDVLSAL